MRGNGRVLRAHQQPRNGVTHHDAETALFSLEKMLWFRQGLLATFGNLFSIFVVCPLMLVACATDLSEQLEATRKGLGTLKAEWGQLRSDMSRLRSDTSRIDESLVQLTGRISEFDRRLLASEIQSEQIAGLQQSETDQELKRAVEVLLKKALENESRLASLEAKRIEARPPESSSTQTVQPSVGPSSSPRTERREIRHGMTQEEVRRMLGDPARTAGYIGTVIWHYPHCR